LPTSSTEKQLLAAVLASPRDDAPRLVYADWLMEKGDPRGELIARQVRDPDGPEDITEEQCRAWFPLRKKDMTVWFRRGFAEKIQIRKVGELDLLGKILAEHPVEHLELADVDRGKAIAKLAASPHLGSIRKLTTVTGHLTAGMIESLLGAKKQAIEELNIEDDFDLDGAQLIARWPNLTRLGIHRFALKLSHALPIVRGPVLTTVRSLGLGTMHDRGKDVSALAAALIANKKVKLTALELHWSKVSAATARALLERFDGLERLTLRNCWITDATARILAARPELAKLKWLRLHENRAIGDAGAKMLATTKFLDKIERLDLSSNKIGAPGQAALRKRFGDRVIL
jgi:uncharacterized protein (TIGR02996 family)